jgi:hypothetical protein
MDNESGGYADRSGGVHPVEGAALLERDDGKGREDGGEDEDAALEVLQTRLDELLAAADVLEVEEAALLLLRELEDERGDEEVEGAE